MNEIENKEQKPKFCRLAILSPLLDIFSLWSGVSVVVLSDFPEKTFMPAWIFFLLFSVCILASIIVGILALYKVRNSHGQLRGDFIALFGIVVALFLIFLSLCYILQ